MKQKPPEKPSSAEPTRPLVDPPAGPPGSKARPERERAVGADREPQNPSDPADPTDRDLGQPKLRASRLSPPALVILAAVAVALIVLLIVFGGLI